MSDKKLANTKVAYRYNSRGLIEGYCPLSGQILSMQASVNDIMVERGPNVLEYIDEDGNKIYLEAGLSLDLVTKAKKTPVFSQFLADLICEHYLENNSIRQACDIVGISYRTLSTWRREHPDFAKQLLDTRKDKAELLSDEMLDVARSTEGDGMQKKLHVDVLKWQTERADAEKYGTKTKISGDKDAPLVFTVETGIRRSIDEGFKDPEEEEEQGEKEVGEIEE